MTALSKNTTYKQMLHLLRAETGIYDDPIFSNEYLIKMIDWEISKFYSQIIGKDFYQKRATFDLSGSANPYYVDLSTTLPFPYQIVDVVYKDATRVSVKKVSRAELEEKTKLSNSYANSIFCSVGGDNIEFSFGDDITVATSQSIEVLYKRQPTLFTGVANKYFAVDSGGTLTTGLKAYYPLWTDANDFWGTNHLSNINAVTFSNNGKISGNANFSQALLQYLKSTTPATTSVTAFTVDMWVFVQDALERGCYFHNGGVGGDGWSLGIGNGTQDTEGNELIGISDAKAWRDFNINIGTGYHHLAMTVEVVGVVLTWKGFVDSVQSATVLTGQIPDVPTALFIGANRPPPGGFPRYVNARICDVSVYDRALSQTELNDKYNGGIGQTLLDNLNTYLDVLDMDIPVISKNVAKQMKTIM